MGSTRNICVQRLEVILLGLGTMFYLGTPNRFLAFHVEPNVVHLSDSVAFGFDEVRRRLQSSSGIQLSLTRIVVSRGVKAGSGARGSSIVQLNAEM